MAISAPTDITGCTLWLDADDAGSFTLTGALVDQWNDKSSSGYNFTASGSARPARSGSVNSRTSVTFDGTDDALARDFTTLQSTGVWNCFAVVKPSAVGTDSNILDQDVVGPRIAQYMRINTGAFESIAFNTSSTPFTDSGVSPSNGTVYVLEARLTTTTVEILANNVSGGTTAFSGTGDSGSLTVAIGRFAGGGGLYAGDIAEIVFYDSALSSGDRTDVYNYLVARWVTAAAIRRPAAAPVWRQSLALT